MKQEYLSIAKGLKFPIDAVTQKLAFIGRSSSGKTYGAGKLAEEFLDNDIQVVVLDPVGVWHGLRSSADGKGKGFSIPVFGGEYGDIPLLPSSGALVANVIIEKGISAVLDVSYMRKNERKEFVTAFAEQFFHLKKKNRSAIHLIIEEAQVFIPQRTMHGEERMLGAMEDICKLGRNYGIGITLISQRPQSIHKDCLNQTEALFAFQINGAHERKAIEEWIVDKGLSKSTVSEDLSGLHVGECFLWSPQWLRILEKIKILPKKTFDASSTPKIGDRIGKARQLAPIDLKKIQTDMESVINTKKENDPSELKKKIFELEKQLKKKQPSVVLSKVTVKDDSEVIELRRQLGEAKKKIGEHESWNRSAIAVIDKLSQTIVEHREKLYGKNPLPLVETKKTITISHSSNKTQMPENTRFTVPSVTHSKAAFTLNNSSKNDSIPKGEKAVLIACAQFPNGLYRNQITVLTQYKRSSRDAYIQRLKEKGLVASNGDKVVITENGVSTLGDDYKPLPTGDELRTHWLNTLPQGEKVMLELISEAYPESITREQLTDKSQYQRSSRDAYLQRMLAKEIIEVTNKGEVKASDALFG